MYYYLNKLVSIVSKNLIKLSQDQITLLLQTSITYNMFIYNDFLRHSMDIILNSNLENKEGFYTELKQFYTEKNKPSQFMSTLFFAKLNKKLGCQDTEIQNELLNMITNSQNRTLRLLKPNYLNDDQLEKITEKDVVKRIDDIDRQQFELEYLIDLKLSRGLYHLNDTQGQDNFIKILNDNYKILTHTFTTKYRKVGDDDKKKIYQNGVYNLALIALKQMKPGNRLTFLNTLIDKLKEKEPEGQDQPTITLLKGLIKPDNEFNHDELLKRTPLLRQYENKSSMYNDDLTCYRIPRTTDKCEVFEENGTKYLGYKNTSTKIQTDLNETTVNLLFGSQSPNGHQIIGNCWLIAPIKKMQINPELKLAVYSHFDAKVENDELQSVTINLKNGKKVTFSKDVVDEVSKIGAAEHLSPAMSCLALLSAIYRKTKDKNGINHIENIFQDNNNEITINKDSKIITINKDSEILSSNFGKDNPILNALRISNEGGNQYKDLLSLFFDKAKQENSSSTTRELIHLPDHAIAHLANQNEFHINPQNSYSVFSFADGKDRDNLIYAKELYEIKYYIPDSEKKNK